MITGDHKDTAVAIAKQLHIIGGRQPGHHRRRARRHPRRPAQRRRAEVQRLRPRPARAQDPHRHRVEKARRHHVHDRRRRQRRALHQAGRHRHRHGHHRHRRHQEPSPTWCWPTTTLPPSSPLSRKAAASTTTSAIHPVPACFQHERGAGRLRLHAAGLYAAQPVHLLFINSSPTASRRWRWAWKKVSPTPMQRRRAARRTASLPAASGLTSPTRACSSPPSPSRRISSALHGGRLLRDAARRQRGRHDDGLPDDEYVRDRAQLQHAQPAQERLHAAQPQPGAVGRHAGQPGADPPSCWKCPSSPRRSASPPSTCPSTSSRWAWPCWCCPSSSSSSSSSAASRPPAPPDRRFGSASAAQGCKTPAFQNKCLCAVHRHLFFCSGCAILNHTICQTERGFGYVFAEKAGRSGRGRRCGGRSRLSAEQARSGGRIRAYRGPGG